MCNSQLCDMQWLPTFIVHSIDMFMFLVLLILVKQRISEVYSTADGLLVPNDIIRPIVHVSTQRVLLDLSGI
jgi:hypothetical protein